MTTLIAFKNRNPTDLLNQKLVQLAREASKFDVDLVSTNGRVVPAHRLILSMYSPYLRRLLKNASPENKMIVPLIDFPYAVLDKVVELFYYGEMRVLTSLKGKVYKALKLLEVDIQEPAKPPPKPKSLPPLDLPIDDGPVHAANANEKSLQTTQISGAKGQPPQQQQQQQQQQLQMQQKQRPQKQQPAKQASNPVLTEAITQNTDAIKDGNGSSNGGGDAHLKSASVTDAAGSNGKVSEWLTEVESATNGASATFSSADLNKSAFNPSMLYDDDIDINMDELEKSVDDLFEDIGAIGSKFIAK